MTFQELNCTIVGVEMKITKRKRVCEAVNNEIDADDDEIDQIDVDVELLEQTEINKNLPINLNGNNSLTANCDKIKKINNCPIKRLEKGIN